MYLVSIITLATIVMEKNFLKSFQLKNIWNTICPCNKIAQTQAGIIPTNIKDCILPVLHTQSNVIRALEIFEIVQAVLEKKI